MSVYRIVSKGPRKMDSCDGDRAKQGLAEESKAAAKMSEE